ncbi:hypothetical protein H6F61_00790 [Cyanobacteria bacterium FACHB-472]|nr:hypothetical protein [Cyanobacteria bacterium FACHB-472]
MALPSGVNLSPGDWKSRLNKLSPLALANALIKILITRAGGFCLYSCGFNRQANVKLTPMPCPYSVNLSPGDWKSRRKQTQSAYPSGTLKRTRTDEISRFL